MKSNLVNKELKAFDELHCTAYGMKAYDKDTTEAEDIIEKAIGELAERRDMMLRFNEACVPMILDNPTELKLKALEIIKELFDFDFALRFGNNQPMIKITNKRNGQYWELPETTEICDLLKKVLL